MRGLGRCSIGVVRLLIRRCQDGGKASIGSARTSRSMNDGVDAKRAGYFIDADRYSVLRRGRQAGQGPQPTGPHRAAVPATFQQLVIPCEQLGGHAPGIQLKGAVIEMILVVVLMQDLAKVRDAEAVWNGHCAKAEVRLEQREEVLRADGALPGQGVATMQRMRPDAGIEIEAEGDSQADVLLSQNAVLPCLRRPSGPFVRTSRQE